MLVSEGEVNAHHWLKDDWLIDRMSLPDWLLSNE